jgi:hypothetical protein
MKCIRQVCLQLDEGGPDASIYFRQHALQLSDVCLFFVSVIFPLIRISEGSSCSQTNCVFGNVSELVCAELRTSGAFACVDSVSVG